MQLRALAQAPVPPRILVRLQVKELEMKLVQRQAPALGLAPQQRAQAPALELAPALAPQQI